MNMKKGIKAIALGMMMLAIVSCDKDHDDLKNIPQPVKTSFKAKYPNANRVEWEQKGEYVVADFNDNHRDAEAWFDAQGNWYMTESDIRKSDLPAAVLDAFNKSTYAQWKIDDLDLFERKDLESIYVIEVEKGEIDVKLFYTANGTLTKELVDVEDDEPILPKPPVGNDVKAAVEERYPAAKIIEIEREHNTIEVNIIHENRVKEVIFNSSIVWLYTSWEVTLAEVPEAVKLAVQAQYPNSRIDDVDFVESPVQSYYLVDIEPADKDVKVTPEGIII